MSSYLIPYLAITRKVEERLADGESVLLFAPRGYGLEAQLKWFEERLGATGDQVCIRLSSRELDAKGQLDFAGLARGVVHQLPVAPRRRAQPKSPPKGADFGQIPFEMALFDAFRACERDTLLIVGGSGRRNSEQHFQLLGALYNVIRRMARQDGPSLKVLATDDYSLYAVEKAYAVLSEWVEYGHRLHWPPLEASELEACLRDLAGRRGQTPTDQDLRDWVARTLAITGGHPGLADVILEDLASAAWRPPPGFWNGDEGPKALWSSDVLRQLDQLIRDDVAGYAHTALQYERPAYPERSDRVEYLEQIGILQRVEGNKRCLCPGLIARWMHRLRAEAPATSPQLGTVIPLFGPRLFVADKLIVDPDTIVAVHLSDLHVCEQHRFRVDRKGDRPILNKWMKRASVLLRDDLRYLDYLDKVNALIISGDFVGRGNDKDDFEAAADLVRDVLRYLDLDPDQMAMVAGNHDIDRPPRGTPLTPERHKQALKNYAEFVAKLRGGKFRTPGLVIVHSPSRRYRLRILELDSNFAEGEASGIGLVPPEAMERADNLLRRDQVPEEVEECYTWIVVHHHVLPATSVRFKQDDRVPISVMSNAVELLQFAVEWKVDLILHGHAHLPCVSETRRWPYDRGDAFRPITAIGAGSFGVMEDHIRPFGRNHYYVLLRQPGQIVIRSRWLGDQGDAFVEHRDLVLPR